MKPRIYTDTSVLGGCEDDEFRDPSRRLLETFVGGELTLVLSELVLRELETAPEGVRMVIGQVPEAHIEAILLSPDAEELAAAYIEEGAIGARMRADALHIALATVARVDVLVSWNFKYSPPTVRSVGPRAAPWAPNTPTWNTRNGIDP